MSYTTPDYVAEEIQATASFDTSTIPTLATVERWIDEVDEYINTLGGRNFEEVTYSEIIDYDGQCVVPLEHSPLTGITDVLYTTSDLGTVAYALTNTASATTDYNFYEDSSELIITTPSRFRVGRKTIQVDYTAGYAVVPNDVQMLSTKMVAQKVLNSLLTGNVNSGNDGGEISVGSIRIVEPGSYGVNSYVKLGETVKELEETIIGKFRVHRYIGRKI